MKMLVTISFTHVFHTHYYMIVKQILLFLIQEVGGIILIIDSDDCGTLMRGNSCLI